jgi:hypothetical protein
VDVFRAADREQSYHFLCRNLEQICIGSNDGTYLGCKRRIRQAVNERIDLGRGQVANSGPVRRREGLLAIGSRPRPLRDLSPSRALFGRVTVEPQRLAF